MTVNTAGYIPIFDFGIPKHIYGKARNAITAGDMVYISDATTLHFTPYNGNNVVIYDTTNAVWKRMIFSEIRSW